MPGSESALNPWLGIPAADYEGHMAAVGQLAALSDIFKDIYEQTRPRRLAILGCATGNGFEHIDPAITDEVLGVDLNPAYLRLALERFPHLAPRLRLLAGDVTRLDREPRSFDLIHAALLLEYLDPELLLTEVSAWLSSAGRCCIVLQLPSKDQPAVTTTRFASLQALGGVMRLHQPVEVEHLAADAGLTKTNDWEVALPNGKKLYVAVFKRADAKALLNGEGP